MKSLVQFVVFAAIVVSADAAAAVIHQDVTPTAADIEHASGNALEALIYTLGALLVALAGGGAFALVFSRLDARARENLERAYLALPPQWQTVIQNALRAAESANNALAEANRTLSDVLRTARRMTDGKEE